MYAIAYYSKIAAAKRRLEETGPSTSSTVPRKKGNDVFDFKILCLFCGEVADEATKAKKSAKYKRVISKFLKI